MKITWINGGGGAGAECVFTFFLLFALSLTYHILSVRKLNTFLRILS